MFVTNGTSKSACVSKLATKVISNYFERYSKCLIKNALAVMGAETTKQIFFFINFFYSKIGTKVKLILKVKNALRIRFEIDF